MLATQEHAVEIDGVHVPPFFQRDLLQIFGQADAGIVNQHMKSAEGTFGFGEHAHPIVFFCHVVVQGNRSIRPFGVNRSRNLRRALRPDVRQSNACAFTGQHNCNGFAESLSGAGDKRDLSRDAIRHDASRGVCRKRTMRRMRARGVNATESAMMALRTPVIWTRLPALKAR